jgi:hypothetical protein
MTLRSALALVLALALVAGPFAAADVLEPPADDNGHASFVRQILPKLLGRKPRGVLEIKLLADIAALEGREAVVRMLMEQDEFRAHWTAVLIDQMETERETSRTQSPVCYGGPLVHAGNLGKAALPPPSLAAFVRDAEITADYPGSFNMYELIQDAIRIDDVFPVYRAYLYVLGNTVQEPGMQNAAEQRAIVGADFDEVFLGRNLDCMTCHNGKNAVTKPKGRHHPLHSGLDQAVFDHIGAIPEVDPAQADQFYICAGCHGATGQGMGDADPIIGATVEDIQTALATVPLMQGIEISSTDIEEIANALRDPGPFSAENLPETAAKHHAFWRRDFFSTDDPDQGFGPWNIDTSCAVVSSGSATEGPIEGFFGGLTTSYGTVKDLDDKLRSGEAQLPGAASIDGDTAFAYMVAARITENVWLELLGSRLTIVNYYARNVQQKDLHRHLTEQVFLANGWSLRELIVEILALGYFNRRAPAASLQTHFDELPAIFDAFAPESRACTDGPEPDPVDDLTFRNESPIHGNTTYAAAGGSTGGDTSGARLEPHFELGDGQACAYNGQGELVHRYSPRTLLQATSKALAWPTPKSFAGGSYPSLAFQKAIGQYISNFDAGRSTVDFESLLNWDDAHSICAKEDKGVAQDWIDALIAGIDPFNTAHPGAPLSLRDVVLTLKDWLIQEPKLSGYVAPSGGGLAAADTLVFGQAPAIATEPALLEALFGVALDTPVTTAGIDAARLRELCGVYLKSPQSMLAGVVRNDALGAPRLRVCNAGPCTYQAMCQAFQPALAKVGHSIQCRASSVAEPFDLTIQTPGGSPTPTGPSSLSR